ncbi:MAG: AI-2E family transporter [Gemmatimonadaceae bacterium]
MLVQALDDADNVTAGGRTAEPSRRSLGITVLAVLAVVYTLYFGHAFFVPIIFAMELNFLLSPAIRWARRRLGLPAGISAAILILSLTGGLGFGVYELAGPARGWLVSAPATLSEAGAKLHTLLKPMEQMSKTAEQMEKASNVTGQPATVRTVVLAGPSMGSRFFGTTQSLVGALLEVLVLLFFLLSAGDLFLQKVIKVLPQATGQRVAVEVARQIETSLSMYLVTSALLNLMEGVVVSGVMFLLGMPNPLLWGAMVTVLEFIPYVGAFAIIVVFTIASLTVFDNVGHALLVPASFVAVNLIQGNFVGPMIMGHRLSLNPVAIFIGVAFWVEVWGIPGAFLAVPLLATLKIVCDHVPSLSPVGEFLGQRDEQERRLAVRAAA